MSETPGFTRRRFVGVAAAALAAGPLGLLGSFRRLDAMAEAPAGVAQKTDSDKAGIRRFQISFPEAALTDLRKRINATKWPEPETVPDATQGVQFATMQKLARYWGNEYDWSKCEARLKAVPHFITEIDGLDIHFIHVRSKHENALPAVITHGWPGSFIEQMKIID